MNLLKRIDYTGQLVMAAGTESSLVRNLVFGGMAGVGAGAMILVLTTIGDFIGTVLIVGGIVAMVTGTIIGIRKGMTAATAIKSMLGKFGDKLEGLVVKTEPIAP